MVPPRLTNCVEDVVLTVELTLFFVDWCRRRPRASNRATWLSYNLYAANLLLAAIFTASGAVLHFTDPLPARPTALWLTFVAACVSTPILFPAVCACALYPDISAKAWAACWFWLCSSSTAHGLLLFTGVDLSTFGVTFDPLTFGGRLLDGRSIGGEQYGIASDLLTSIPSTRGDGLFLHAGLFTVAVLGAFCMCLAAAQDASLPEEKKYSVWRLVLALGIMLFGQVAMIPLLCVIGVPYTLDVWHVSIFVVMALAYASLCDLVLGIKEASDKKQA